MSSSLKQSKCTKKVEEKSTVDSAAIEAFLHKVEEEKRREEDKRKKQKEELIKFRLAAQGGKANKKIAKHFGTTPFNLQIKYGNEVHVDTILKREQREKEEIQKLGNIYKENIIAKRKQLQMKQNAQISHAHSSQSATPISKSFISSGLKHVSKEDNGGSVSNSPGSNSNEKKIVLKRRAPQGELDFNVLMQKAEQNQKQKLLENMIASPSPAKRPSYDDDDIRIQKQVLKNNDQISMASSKLPEKSYSNKSGLMKTTNCAVKKRIQTVPQMPRRETNQTKRILPGDIRYPRNELGVQPKTQIMVSIHSDHESNFQLPIYVCWKVIRMKVAIQDLIHTPCDQQSLFYKGQELTDNQFLTHYNIRDTSDIIRLVILKNSSISQTIFDSIEDQSKNLFSPNSFETEFNADYTKIFKETTSYFRGGYPYKRPIGAYRYGLKVLGRYPDNIWLGSPGGHRTGSDDGEWPIAYHGTGEMNATQIFKEGFKKEMGQRFAYGVGIYCSPDPQTALSYATEFEFQGCRYRAVIQVRVNPHGFNVARRGSNSDGDGDYWLVGNNDDIRPYGLCIFNDDDIRNKNKKTKTLPSSTKRIGYTSPVQANSAFVKQLCGKLPTFFANNKNPFKLCNFRVKK